MLQSTLHAIHFKHVLNCGERQLLNTDQNAMDRTTAGSTLVFLELIGQAVEETRFH
jgi:hypothetical protein